jgi:tetratricopeptide (TPR) repeat protein
MAGLTVLCLPLCFAGCRTNGSTGNGADLTLYKEQQDLSKALAHYSQGLMLEWEHSLGSKALEQFELASKLDPSSDLAREKLALAALRLQKSDEAIAALRETCRQSPNSAQAWIDLGATCQLTGHPDLALEYYSAALNLTPTNTLLYLEIARLNFRQKNDAKAIKSLQDGLKQTDARQLFLAFARSVCQELIEAKSFERAVDCLQFVVDNLQQSESEQRQMSYNLIGELQLRLGEEKKAERSFLLATKENPPLPDSFVRLACIYLDHDPSKAVDTLLNAEKRLPDNSIILNSLGLIYASLKDYEKAIGVLERVRDIHERSGLDMTPTFYLTLGSAYERAGKLEKTEQVLEKCIELYPNDHEAMNYLAYTWAEKGIKLEKALEYVIRALDLDPGNGAYVDTLGWVYFMQKDYPKALEQLKKANDIVKDDPTVTEHLGDAFHSMNDDEKALYYWKHSFILDTENEPLARKLESYGVNLDALRKEARRVAQQADKNASD